MDMSQRIWRVLTGFLLAAALLAGPVRSAAPDVRVIETPWLPPGEERLLVDSCDGLCDGLRTFAPPGAVSVKLCGTGGGTFPVPQGSAVVTPEGFAIPTGRVFTLTAQAEAFEPDGTWADDFPVQLGLAAVPKGLLPQGSIIYVVSEDGSWEYGAALVAGETEETLQLFMEDAEACAAFGERSCLVYEVG